MRERPAGLEPIIRAVALGDRAGAPEEGYPWNLPVVDSLRAEFVLHPGVTYLVGENGSGKSTLLEGIAVAAGMNPEGGSSNANFSTRASHSPLGEGLRLIRSGRRAWTDFFLRAESLFTTATYLEELPSPNPMAAYGGRSLHEQSHGESFLAVLMERFGPNGLYLLDEPEAALSPQNCLAALARIHDLVCDGAQFVIATHSPIVLAHPDAAIYECDEDGLREIDYEQAEPVRLLSGFLTDRERYLAHLLD